MIDQWQFDVFAGMIRQEQKTYRIQVVRPTEFRLLSSNSTSGMICDSFQPDDSADCRHNLVDWCYRMIDFCHLSRETVAIAMNFVDRFVTSDQGKGYLINHTMYQLVAVTALYTAIKIHERQAIEL